MIIIDQGMYAKSPGMRGSEEDEVVESRDCRSQWNKRTVGVGSTRENSGSTREMLDIENLKALLI